MLPIEHLAGNGLHIPLPDPSVRRIYDQRGVLVDMSNPKTVWEDHAWKIIFDNCNANEPGFNPFWHGKGRKMYSPTRWVEGIASRQSPNFAPNLRFPRVDRGRWAGLAYEMIYSLTVTCNQLGEDVTVNTDVLHLIARQNPSIVRLLVDSLEEGNTDVDVSADLELARIMATLLA